MNTTNFHLRGILIDGECPKCLEENHPCNICIEEYTNEFYQPFVETYANIINEGLSNGNVHTFQITIMKDNSSSNLIWTYIARPLGNKETYFGSYDQFDMLSSLLRHNSMLDIKVRVEMLS